MFKCNIVMMYQDLLHQHLVVVEIKMKLISNSLMKMVLLLKLHITMLKEHLQHLLIHVMEHIVIIVTVNYIGVTARIARRGVIERHPSVKITAELVLPLGV